MRPIRLSRRHVSEATWRVLLESGYTNGDEPRSKLLREADELETLRASADYNTGSISASTCWLLFLAARYLQPRVVAEVGTFIGKSTLSMLRGIECSGLQHGVIFTCDFSNDITLPFCEGGKVVQFPKTASTGMFEVLIERGVKCDFLALDGRLQPEDFPLLGKLMHSNTIFLLDDFEGVEKGVINATALMGSLQETHNLIYPPSMELLRQFGLMDSCTTSMIVPRQLFLLSNQ